MWTALCALFGIAGFFFALNVFEKNNILSLALGVVSVMLILLALTFDPVGWIFRSTIDKRPYDSAGNPNFWADIKNLTYIHKLDSEVEACNLPQFQDTLETNFGTYKICTMHGTGRGVLYEAAGAVRQIMDSALFYKNDNKTWLLYPGEEFELGKNYAARYAGVPCTQIFSVQAGGSSQNKEDGLEYVVMKNGKWQEPFLWEDPTRVTFHFVERVKVRSPDNLPRIAFFNVIDSTRYNGEAGAPAFCMHW